jgi:hypothetical protein
VSCDHITADAIVPGLGHLTENYTLQLDIRSDTCQHATFTNNVMTVPGKGEIQVSLKDPGPSGLRRL